ncbi:MAG: sodium:proton antiporter [Actinomycetota bacterium]|nr:sodium:proton antiporter [Actinomycetota bacterium]
MTTPASPPRRRLAAAVLVAGTAACLVVAFLDLPRDGAELPAIARDAMLQALPEWHHTEVVTTIVYGTRGFDTFGETFLLLAAVVGVIVVCRGREPRRVFLQEDRLGRREQAEARRSRRAGTGAPRHPQTEHAEEVEQGQAGEPEGKGGIGAPAPVSQPTMTPVIRAGARTVLPVLAVAGGFLLFSPWAPGGGFPGGAVLSGVVLLSYAAYGYRAVRPVVRPGLLETIELAGAGAIIAIGLTGLVVRGSFLANWLPLGTPETIHAGGILQWFSVSELVEVGTGLLIVVFSILAMEREWTEEDAEGQDHGHRHRHRHRQAEEAP